MDILSGYKTYIASAIAAFVALNSVLHIVTPEVQNALLALAAALGLYGMRSALAQAEKKS